jgi:hypothetical protein
VWLALQIETVTSIGRATIPPTVRRGGRICTYLHCSLYIGHVLKEAYYSHMVQCADLDTCYAITPSQDLALQQETARL